MIKNIVFSGAGIKIYSFIGSLKALEEFNILKNVQSYIGTSSGSLIATLLCIGFTPLEIEKILIKLDTEKIKNISTDNILKFFKNYGVDDGSSITRIIKIIFNSKLNNEEITFKELFQLTNKKLVITASCLNNMEIKYFDYERTPDVRILDSLLMSICVPILFTPRNIDGNLFSDGGLISNYPIEYFKDDIKNTIGVMVSPKYDGNHEIKNITDYLYRIFLCPYKKLIKLVYEIYKENTILIENNTSFLDFNLDYNSKINLIEEGYNISKSFLEKEETKTYFNLS